jgi:hypothetical protein
LLAWVVCCLAAHTRRSRVWASSVLRPHPSSTQPAKRSSEMRVRAVGCISQCGELEAEVGRLKEARKELKQKLLERDSAAVQVRWRVEDTH